MSAKNNLTYLAVAALLGLVLFYAAWLFSDYADGLHIQGAVDLSMRHVFDELAAYRAVNGKWPATAEEAVGQGSLFFAPIDAISRKPFRYNPEATPGTNEVLLTQPVPINVGIWPFNQTWLRGITADGTLIDLPPDNAPIDHLK